MEAKGKTLLLVVSIIMVIGGGLSIVIGILGAIGGGVVAGAVEGGGAVGGLLIGASIYSAVCGIIQLVIAIIGIKNSGKVEGAQLCFKLGIVMIVLAALSVVITTVSSGFTITSLFGFLLPVLYTVGANMNKQAA